MPKTKTSISRIGFISTVMNMALIPRHHTRGFPNTSVMRYIIQKAMKKLHSEVMKGMMLCFPFLKLLGKIPILTSSIFHES